jgi:hypothetical protein
MSARERSIREWTEGSNRLHLCPRIHLSHLQPDKVWEKTMKLPWVTILLAKIQKSLDSLTLKNDVSGKPAPGGWTWTGAFVYHWQHIESPNICCKQDGLSEPLGRHFGYKTSNRCRSETFLIVAWQNHGPVNSVNGFMLKRNRHVQQMVKPF